MARLKRLSTADKAGHGDYRFASTRWTTTARLVWLATAIPLTVRNACIPMASCGSQTSSYVPSANRRIHHNRVRPETQRDEVRAGRGTTELGAFRNHFEVDVVHRLSLLHELDRVATRGREPGRLKGKGHLPRLLDELHDDEMRCGRLPPGAVVASRIATSLASTRVEFSSWLRSDLRC